MQDAISTADRVAPFATTVLIQGESGTGKELIARRIHQLSPRKNLAFVAVNCGAIPETLIEAELFGHKRGAFTDAIKDRPGYFEEAGEGTLFLDEIAELPIHLQSKLLRALQEKTFKAIGAEKESHVKCRIIAATHKDLEQEVKEKRFREDLFFRINIVSIKIPPLRERRDEILSLVEHFIEKFSKKHKLNPATLSLESQELLVNFAWRGNVRELENCIEHALILVEKEVILPIHLPKTIKEQYNSKDRSLSFLFEDDSLSIKKKTKKLAITACVLLNF